MRSERAVEKCPSDTRGARPAKRLLDNLPTSATSYFSVSRKGKVCAVERAAKLECNSFSVGGQILVRGLLMAR